MFSAALLLDFITYYRVSINLSFFRCIYFRALLPNSREIYGLELPQAFRGLLDGVLHPAPDRRFTLEQAFDYMDSHPDMF